MSQEDLTRFLDAWPYEGGRVSVRRIEGEDGRPKIQVRIDLGIIQMELDGRPDGREFEGFTSLLDYQNHRLAQYTTESGASTGFVLTPQECRLLREEAVQFYHRYVALFSLEAFDHVIRDTDRNLSAFDLCRDYGTTDADRTILEQFRPHVITMRARAQAELALRAKQPRQALAALDRGLNEIQAFFSELGDVNAIEHSNDVQLLRGMRDALVPKLPASQRVELEERLLAALDAENYELAAILRDELRLLRD